MSWSLPANLLGNEHIKHAILTAALQHDHWVNDRKRFTRTHSSLQSMFNLRISSQWLKTNKDIITAELATFVLPDETELKTLKVTPSLTLSSRVLHVFIVVLHVVCEGPTLHRFSVSKS